MRRDLVEKDTVTKVTKTLQVFFVFFSSQMTCALCVFSQSVFSKVRKILPLVL